MIHNPEKILFAWGQDEEEGAMASDDLNRLLRILKHSGTNSFAFGIKCSALTTESDGMVFKIKGESYHVFFMKYSYVGEEIEISSYDFDESSIPTSLTIEGINLPDELDKFIVLNQMYSGEVVSHLCTELQEDYSKVCQTGSLQDVDNLYAKFGNDIMQCFDALELSPGGYTLPQITEILTQLQSEARDNQQFEFTQNGLVYRLDEQGQAKIIEDAPTDAEISAGNWIEGSIDMKMRVGFNADGILQFAAVGIRKNLSIASGNTASLSEISANMLVKSNALLKEYHVKDIKTTLNDVGANLDSEAFPDGKKVAIDQKATFIKILCEAVGVGVTFIKTAEIERPVYLNEQENTIKAPPICTGSLEGGAKSIVDITSMVTMIYDIVTDKQARKEAKEGFNAIKEQVKDDPRLLFPILGEIVLEEFTGSDSDALSEMFDESADGGRKGHLISKTSVRTATSVFATGKFLAKLPDMAIQMAAKMPKAKLWLRFKNLDDGLSNNLLKKLDELPDGGNKFLDDFAGASDETLGKILNNSNLVDSWKVLDDAGLNKTLCSDPDKLTKVNRYLDNNPAKKDAFIDDLKNTSDPVKFVDRTSWKDDLIQKYGDDINQFKPQGLNKSNVPQSVVDDMLSASNAPDQIKEGLIERFIKSGSDVPSKQPVSVGDELYKISPKSEGVDEFSAFWVKKGELDKLRASGNIEQKLGLPLNSHAVEYDVYKITATQSGEVFNSTVSKTVQNGYETLGGATQSLVLNRELWSIPVKIETYLP